MINQVAPISEPWVAIMDHSIDIGVKKVLVVLRVRLSALMERGSAITLEDCQCIGLRISEKTNGQTIAAELKSIFELAGSPSTIIKDGGRDLARGVDLWRKQENQMQVKVIADIGHVVANAIKSQFSDSKLFNLFLDLVNRCARQLRQTNLAFLKPPKIRTKGRFQGIAVFVDWATKILDLVDETKSNPNFKKLRTSLRGLSSLKTFLKGFAETILITSAIMKVLKNAGLNQMSYHECLALAEAMSPRSPVKRTIIDWLDTHIRIQGQMSIGQTPLIVSSDIIESLFGKFKHILDRGAMVDMNRTVLLIPALCGKIEAATILPLLERTPHSAIESWDRQNIPYTQNRRRRHFLQGKSHDEVPLSGNLYSHTG